MTLAEQLACKPAKGSCTNRWRGTAFAATLAATAARSLPGLPASAKSGSISGGKLMVPYGYVNALHCDPIEKKPFFHALPGTRALSFGLLGCDLHCGYCQNWVTSQALRDFRSSLDFREIAPAEIVGLALRQNASSIISTYNEPLITSEWAVAVFREARRAGLCHRIRLQRERHSPGAGVSAPLGRSLQGGSEELRRPPISRVGRASRTDPRFNRAHPPHGVLAGSRHARRAWFQRFAPRNCRRSRASWLESLRTSPGMSPRSIRTTR